MEQELPIVERFYLHKPLTASLKLLFLKLKDRLKGRSTHTNHRLSTLMRNDTQRNLLLYGLKKHLI